jgi:tetratricopeptide (TPR) repeat protein
MSKKRSFPAAPRGGQIDALLKAYQAGNWHESEQLGRLFMAEQGSDAPSQHLLGLLARHRGDNLGAVRWTVRAIVLEPDAALYRSNLGTALQDLGAFEQAALAYRTALILDPALAETYHNYANLLRLQERQTVAASSYRHAIQLHPSLAASLINLAHTTWTISGAKVAMPIAKGAVSVAPDQYEAYAVLGDLQDEERAPDGAALGIYRSAARLSPHAADAHFNLGRAFQSLGRSAQAVQAYRGAIALSPGHHEAWFNKGAAENYAGRLEQAAKDYSVAVTLAPRIPLYYRHLLDLRPVEPGEPIPRILERLAEDSRSLSSAERMDLHFVLGDAYDKRGDPERSFGHFLEGNRLKRDQIEYDEAQTLSAFRYIEKTFTKEFVKRHAGSGNPTSVPVFIIGMPRSGTSLIEQILASHPQVFGGGERDDFSLLATRERAYPALLSTLTRESLPRLGTDYIDSLRSAAPPSAIRITDKMPGNFRFAGLIHLALPNARIIHCRRDPMDTCLSGFSKLFSGQQPYSYNLTELGHYYRAYESLMDHWHSVLPAGAILDVQYEDVVDDLEGQARRIVDACGLDWDPACLSFHRTERSVGTASAAQVRRPIYSNSIGRWKKFGSLLEPLRVALGGETEPVTETVSEMVPEILAAAQARHFGGKLREAIALYRRVLVHDPQNADALHLVGAAAYQAGSPGDALAGVLRALSVDPMNAAYHCNRGAFLGALNRSAEAVLSYGNAIVLRPDYHEAYTNLAYALTDIQKTDSAMSSAWRSVKILPDDVGGRSNLGMALREAKRSQEAVLIHRITICISPDRAESYSNFGTSLQDMNLHSEAEDAFRRAISLKNDLSDAYYNMGNEWWKSGRVADSVAAYIAAILLKPDLDKAYCNLGNSFQELGALDRCLGSYQRALLLTPNATAYHRNVSLLKVFEGEDPSIAVMEGLLAGSAPLAPEERTQLGYALGTAYAKVGEHDRSIRHFIEGAKWKRAHSLYDEANTLEGFRLIERLFTKDFLQRHIGSGNPASEPIFIVGMPRSGTSLTEQILASHPQVFGAGEREDFSLLANRGEGYPASLLALTPESLKLMGDEYIAGLRVAAPPSATRITDKMPDNFLFLGLIHLALPNARIIHCRRDPVDTCLSCFTTLFTSEMPHTYNLAELGHYYRAYEALMEHWRSVLPEGRIIEVQYEDVVDDLEGQARRLLAALDLEWDPACLDFHRTERPVRTASAAQVRNPIYRSSVRKWEKYASHLGPLLEALQSSGEEEMTQITVDGTVYELESMTDDQKQQVTNLQFCDAEILRLNSQLSVFQTARISYAAALKELLSKK